MQNPTWQPLQSGVITADFKQNMYLLRKAAHIDESEDVILRRFNVLGHPAALLYVDGMTDGDALQRYFIEPLLHAGPCGEEPLDSYFAESVLPLSSISPTA